MGNIKGLLDLLQTGERFESSPLKAKDITEIGKLLGIKFPASYKEFLRTYKVPSSKAYICFCGDSYANSFGISFSREENRYIDSEEDQIVIEFDWHNYDTSSVDAFVRSFREKNDGTDAWAKAGFIYLGEFRGYQVYLDTKEDVVYSIYHEDLYESEDYDDPKAARACMEENAHELCDNFEQFLKVICTGKPFDEDEHVLYGEEQTEEQPSETQADLTSCVIRLGEASSTPIKNRDKIGGYPTYLPDEVAELDDSDSYFLMEIYNHGFADPDIICWQFYCMEMSAAMIKQVREIRKGAKPYDDSSKLIRKRRWLHEFPLILESCDVKKLDEDQSRIGGKVPKKAKNAFKRKQIAYLGVIEEKLVPDKELNITYYDDDGCIVFGFDPAGKMHVEVFD